MKIQSWMIKSWATLEWYLPQAPDLRLRLRHLHSQLRTGNGNPRQGETVWTADIDGRPAAMAWEWAEFRPGVVLLADPNCIVSNLRFVDDAQSALPAPVALIALNRIVHALPWQRAVCRMLASQPAPAGTEAAMAGAPEPAAGTGTREPTTLPPAPKSADDPDSRVATLAAWRGVSVPGIPTKRLSPGRRRTDRGVESDRRAA